MENSKSFLGTGWSFPPRFSDTLSGVEMVSDEDDIKQSLFILLSTRPGERITNLQYGCNLHDILFRKIDATTMGLIEEVIKNAVLYFEPRITLKDVIIDESSQKDGILYIKLNYIVRKTNIRSNIVFPFYKIEGTDISPT